jgi:hypothetical protein
MDENGEVKFKAFMDIWTGSLRLLGTANATGALAAGAAYQAFDKKPDIQSEMKVLVFLFLLGVISFALSQIGMFNTQMSMAIYFQRSRESCEWEKVFWKIERQQQQQPDPLVVAKWGYILMFFLGIASLSCFLLGLILVTFFVNGL